MKISEHLDLSELIRSESAKRNGISNMPTEAHIANLKLLAEKIFEPIRNNFRCPIHVSSGYRSKELNAKVGGATTSQHSSGEAIDLDMDGTPNGVTNKMIFDYIYKRIQEEKIVSVKTIKDGGVAVTVAKMSFGNLLGAEISIDEKLLLEKNIGGLVIESTEKLDSNLLQLLGEVKDSEMLKISNLNFNIKKLLEVNSGTFENLFPTKEKERIQ